MGERPGLRRTDFGSTAPKPKPMNGLTDRSMTGGLGQMSLQGAGVRKSLVAAGSLSESHNPYSMYGDSENLDDGIHEGLQSQTNGHNNGEVSGDLPPEDEIRREFADFMEVMSPMSEPEEIALRNTNMTEKWNFIMNQRERSPIFNIRYFIEGLRSNQGTRRKKFSLGKSSKGVSELTYLLRKLKVDLKMSAPSFLEEFSEPPNGGLHLLVQLLKSMQGEKQILHTSRKSRMEEWRRLLGDEADCLLCLKFLTRTEEGRNKLARQEGIFHLIIESTLSIQSKSRAVALQLLSILCEASTSGYQQIMEVMRQQQHRREEPALFRPLVTTLNAADGDAELPFMVAAVHLFNTMISSLSNCNASVHLQYELEQAGFNPDQLDKFSYGESLDQEDLSRELDIWRKNYIDVTSTREEITALENRNQILREEVTRLQDQLRNIEKTNRQQEREKRRMSEKRDDYRERAAELQDTVAKLTKLYADTVGQEASEVNVEEVLKPLDTPSDLSASDKYATVRSVSSVTDEIPPVPMLGPPPMPPGAPPLPPPAPPMMPAKRKITSSVELPMLNWIPIKTVTNTIFQDLDEEQIYNQIDFADFESRFKLDRRPETPAMRERRLRMVSKQKTDKLLFVNLNRAKNLCITKHRTGLTSRQIREAIERCDVKALSGDYAELLIKFIPTKEELKLLAQHRDEYWKMGEAEQFLFQLAQVERLESKLSVLAFIGIFDELIHTVSPSVAQVLEASISVAQNRKLKKIFQIILAFGNYMNGAKRGYTMGFRLESLYKLPDVKTVDKKQTLMHYLAEQVASNYAELLTFYDDVKLRVNKGASFYSMQQDVKGLRKGLDLVKFEKEKQGNNPVLEHFYSEAAEQVTEVAENFKRMEEGYKEVCLAFGESYKHIEPDVFFGTLSDFSNNFKKARQENLQKATRMLAASASRHSIISNTSSVQSESSGASLASPRKLSPVTNNIPKPAASTKKEAPRILAALTPQLAPKVKGQGNRLEPPRGGSTGPVTAQHDIVAPVTSQKDMRSTPGPEKQITTKRAAPVPPSTATTGVALTNGVMKAKADDKQDTGKPALKLKIPERPRTSSEPSTADIMAALGTLDQVVDDEEKLEGIPERETYTSYL